MAGGIRDIASEPVDGRGRRTADHAERPAHNVHRGCQLGVPPTAYSVAVIRPTLATSACDS
jgi:hypothetical protein